jgi:predicted cobalt transporter CbtA
MSLQRVFTVASVAGLLAGLVFGLLQERREVAIIQAAKHFEATHGHTMSALERASFQF